MDQNYDRTKNRTIREGIVPMEHVSIGEDGIQRWGGNGVWYEAKNGQISRIIIVNPGPHYEMPTDCPTFTDDGDPGDEHCSRCCP